MTSPIKLFLVIGDPIHHSRSPRMHEAGYAACGIGDQYRFSFAQVNKESLTDSLSAMKTLGISGAACTMPLKEALLNAVDHLSPEAAQIGAVNTITFREDGVYGHNTDWIGITRPLLAIRSWQGARALVLGAGGAAAAALYALKTLKVSAFISNRTADKAKLLASRLDATLVPWEMRSSNSSYDIIINATSIGMNQTIGQSPLEDSTILKNQLLFETIYAPSETTLVKQAKKVGASVVLGREMLLYQGAAQFELWTGHPAPIEKMRASLLD